jgi:predicted AAA+ superfamily ATPase
MRPFTLSERGVGSPTVSLRQLLRGGEPEVSGQTEVALADYVYEVVNSGFPGIRRFSGRARRALLDGYLQRIVDTDFQEQGFTVRRPETLKRWMGAYAAATATTASYEAIGDAATRGLGDKPAKTTTQPYR